MNCIVGVKNTEKGISIPLYGVLERLVNIKDFRIVDKYQGF